MDRGQPRGGRHWQRLVLGATAVGAAGLSARYAGRQLMQRVAPDPYTNPRRFDLSFEEVAFPSRDGITIRGWLIPADERRATVVICPGYFGSMHSDLGYVPWLCDAGYDVLLFDWRGRGRSDGNATSIGILERRDLLGAVDWLAGRGVNRLGVLGFSMGGAVAVAASPLAPNIAAVVADSPFARVGDTVVAGMVRRSLPEAVAQLAAPAIIWSAGLQLGVDLTVINPTRWAAFLGAPLLLMHGERDPYLPPEAARELFSLAPEPKELWSIAEAGHRELYRQRPEAYQARVLAFFRQWLDGAGVD